MTNLMRYLTIGFKIAILGLVVALLLWIPNTIAGLIGVFSWGFAAVIYIVALLCGWILLGYLAFKYKGWIFK